MPTGPYPAVLWELRGKSGVSATCSLRELGGCRFAIEITIGPNEIMRETFKREPDALDHAKYLRRDFVGSGWTETFSRDD
jgi:hypothetical protein